MAVVTVSRSRDRLIAVKHVPAARAAEIEREAELLKRLEHPGLVRFVGLIETDDGGRALHTEFVSSDTWATRPLTDPAERAAGMAALAAVVADLHHLGVAHLQISAGHVLHGEDDQPVLCSLTRAGEATSENRHADLASLAELCHDQSLDRGALNPRLEALADDARAGRLTARELAGRLDLLAARRPGARPAPVRAARGGIVDRLRLRLTRRSLVAAVAVVIAAAVAFQVGSRLREPQPLPAIQAYQPAEAGSTGAADGPEPAAPPPQGVLLETGDGAWGAPLGAPALAPEPGTAIEAVPAQEAVPGHEAASTHESAPTGEAVPGHGAVAAHEAVPGHEAVPTGEAVPGHGAVAAHEAAAVLEHGGRRYAVGATGDFVATGDWDCDGEATAAIVRPSTGGVVVFDAWPGPGQTIAVPVRWTVDSPTGAQAVAHGRCDLLRVHTTAGSRLFDPADQ